MYGFNSALERCHDDFISWVAVTAQQIEAAGKAPGAVIGGSVLEGRDLNLQRVFRLPIDSLELARHVNEFLAERPAL